MYYLSRSPELILMFDSLSLISELMAMTHPHDNIRVGAITFVSTPLQSEAGYFPAFLLSEIH